MDTKYKYQVIEDNGGGLSLFVWRGRKVIYSHSGYEFNHGQLVQDLDALDAGTDVSDWDGCDETPQADYDSITSSEYGWQIVASSTGKGRKLHKAVMGRAAMHEFGVTEEDHDMAQSAARMGRASGGAKAAAVRENGKKGGRPKAAKL